MKTNNYYLESRYYDSEIRRFINEDVYISTGVGTLRNNMYLYCLNNPIKYRDLKGESAVLTIMAIAGCIGGASSFFVAPTSNDIKKSADKHYARNKLNKVSLTVDEIMQRYDKQTEDMDALHEYTHGKQGKEGIYNDKYLSPDGGHLEVIICSPPNKSSYIVNEYVDEINMGTYNYASNEIPGLYHVDHLVRDVLPYSLYGNTLEDKTGALKWVIE